MDSDHWICDYVVTLRPAQADPVSLVASAIADPTRRLLLERLVATPGMTSGDLAALVPQHTRFAVLKHIRVLEGAGLVRVMHDGRRRRHFAERAAFAELRAWMERMGGNPRRRATR
jgi:DNA-binding transcriptional ArsR family regulator